MTVINYHYRKQLIHIQTDDEREALIDRDLFSAYLSAAGFHRQWPKQNTLLDLLTDFVIENDIELTDIEQVQDIRIEGMQAAPSKTTHR